MRPPRHRLPAVVFDEIASGGGGPAAIAMLRRAELSRRLVLLRAVVDAADQAGPASGAAARHGYDALAAIHAIRRQQCGRC